MEGTELSQIMLSRRQEKRKIRLILTVLEKRRTRLILGTELSQIMLSRRQERSKTRLIHIVSGLF